MPEVFSGRGRAYLPALFESFALHAFYEYGDESGLSAFTGKNIFRCRHRSAPLKGGSGQKLIHSSKYHGNKKLGYELGRMAATTYRETGLFDTVDLLLPVPLHPKRMRQRGYNQSEWIAYGIRSVTGIAVDTSSLSRIKKTESQTRKQIFERSENVEDIFRVENTDTLKNKHILLVDDVITTGSTMNACAEAMKAISGIRISILGIAVA